MSKVFRKELPIKGDFGIALGVIVVSTNYKMKVERNEDKVNQEVLTRQFYVHKVETFIADKAFQEELEIPSDQKLVWAIEKLEKNLFDELTKRVSYAPVETFAETLGKLGFEAVNLI